MDKGDVLIAVNPRPKHLTHGKEYVVCWLGYGGRFVAVRNDVGQIIPYRNDNFRIKKASA